MKMLNLKVMTMAAAMMVATCLTASASTVKGTLHANQDTIKKVKMKHGKMKTKMKKDTTAKM